MEDPYHYAKVLDFKEFDTAEKIVDAVLNRLNDGTGRCVSPGLGYCAYRDRGNACAVGIFIPNGVINASNSSNRFMSLEELRRSLVNDGNYELADWIETFMPLLDLLQICHDNRENWRDPTDYDMRGEDSKVFHFDLKASLKRRGLL